MDPTMSLSRNWFTRSLYSLLAFALACLACSQSPDNLPELELYPTWSAVGLEITYPPGWPMDDPGSFEWREQGGPWRPGVTLTPYRDEGRALASIWPLEQDIGIEVRLNVPGAGTEITGKTRTRKIVLETSGGRKVHVSPDGRPGAEGTAGDPYVSIAEAGKNAGPGDMIIIHGGLYREGGLFAGLKGSPDRPIVITGTDGEHPVVDGSLVIARGEKAWQEAGTGLWTIGFKSPTGYSGYLAQDELRMFWYKSLENIEKGEILLNDKKTYSNIGRGWFYDNDSQRLYVRTGDGSAPSEHEYCLAIHPHGALLSGSEYVVIRGIEFRYFGASGICLEKGTRGCIINGNVVHHAQQGIIFNDSLTRDNAVWNNEVYERGLLDYTWSQIKASQYGRQAIDGVAGRGNSFCYNLLHGYFDAIAPALWGHPGQFHLNRDLDLMYNRIYNIGDDAIEVEGGGLNVRVHGNTMRNCFAAISLAPIEHGPTYVTRNDATYHILMFKLNVGGVTSNGHTYCYHNSAYCLTRGKQYGGTAISFPSAGSIPIDNKHFVNNAFICDGLGPRNANNRYRIDYNCYYSVPGQEPVIFQWEELRDGRWRSTEYTSIEQFSRETGRESHGLLADPKFRSTEGAGSLERVFYSRQPFKVYPMIEGPDVGDMRLMETSPCIDRGVVIPGINDHLPDGKPDIGAFEHGE